MSEEPQVMWPLRRFDLSPVGTQMQTNIQDISGYEDISIHSLISNCPYLWPKTLQPHNNYVLHTSAHTIWELVTPVQWEVSRLSPNSASS